ncbi:MCE family protein [Nocardioides dubius]|uniref:MCE family protein n=1 Tax=Nocardioides dubius TaxID=317019 RepID=A0ABN1TQR6_9ACTN
MSTLRSRQGRRHGLRLGLLVALVLTLTSCGFSVYKLPLPGGADVGSDPIKVTVTFPDVLDLVPQSTVKVNDITVGKVSDVKLVGYQAEVELTLRNDVDLPDNAEAEIRQTSLLGEKFVSLNAPADPTEGRLGDGDRIGVKRTNRNPEVEEVLSALSLVLNGGGVAQLKVISSELNKALEGREGSARSVLTQLETFMGELDTNKQNIVTAIERLNDLSTSANQQRDTINAALDELPEALESLDSQRGDLVKMLEALSKLGNTGTRVIKASKTATIDALTQLQPVLSQLAASGDSFAEAFHAFLTYPFVDEAVGRDPEMAKNLHMGDFVNLSIKLDIRLLDTSGNGILPTLLPTEIDPSHVVNDVLTCLSASNLSAAACQRVLAVPGNLLQLLSLCALDKNQDKLVCGLLAPILRPGKGGGFLPLGSEKSGGSDAEAGSGLDAGLKDVLGSLGLNRAGEPALELKIGDLGAEYDPTLAGLMLRGVAQ